MPKRDIEGKGSDARVVELSITPWQRDFFRVLNALQTTSTTTITSGVLALRFPTRLSESRRRSDPNTPQRC
jgi:hypothetical protein